MDQLEFTHIDSTDQSPIQLFQLNSPRTSVCFCEWGGGGGSQVHSLTDRAGSPPPWMRAYQLLIRQCCS